MKFENTENLYNDTTGWIETANGEPFHPDRPQFSIDVIAHSLGFNCRFNGHCKYFYSIAEHSMLVAKFMEYLNLGNPLEGLLHDASEAYMTDVPAPFKRKFPELGKMDKAIDASLRLHFGLPETITTGCKKADWQILFSEAYWLLPSRGETFHDPYNLRAESIQYFDMFRPQCLDPYESGKKFLSLYKGLHAKR